jgi:hypothetical protein
MLRQNDSWRRIRTPQDISNVVRYLSPDEIDFMTGSVVLGTAGAAGQTYPQLIRRPA